VWQRQRILRWLVVIAVAVLLGGWMVGLELWETRPALLAKLAMTALDWASVHVLTVAAAGLLVSIAGLSMPLLMRRLQRRDAATQQRESRDRKVMLARIRYRWISGVLDQSLGRRVHMRLDLIRRPTAIRSPDVPVLRREQPPAPLPSGIAISTLFQELGGGLLILGAPGSGKTTALLELTRDLIDRAEADQSQPIPVVFNLSSWAAERPSVDEWLIDELRIRYGVPRAIGTHWLSAGEILPLLDGLDEVAKAQRSSCVERINVFLREYGLVRLAVCSRRQEYSVLDARLEVEEAVELQPPTRQQVDDYLAAAGSAMAGVRTALAADPSLWELLSSPLMLNIVVLTYEDSRSDVVLATARRQRLTLLFDAYTDRMLGHRRSRYTPAQMMDWLAWLAQAMRDRNQSEFQLDRLTPAWLPTTIQRRLVAVSPAVGVGLLVGLIGGLTEGFVDGLTAGVVSGLCNLSFFVLVFGLRQTERSDQAASYWPRVCIALVIGVAIYGLCYGLVWGPFYGLFDGLVFGMAAWLAYGLRKMEPVEELTWSWTRARPSLRIGLPYGLFVGVLVALVYGPVGGLAMGLVAMAVSGLAPGLVVEPGELPNAVGGSSVAEGAVGAPLVVVVHPVWQ
jgi:DNA polymerase III delta prime subunit